MITDVESSVFLSADIPEDARTWRNHPSIYRWCRQYTPLSESDHYAWLARLKTDDSVRMFGIFETARGTAVGVCGLTSINRVNQSAEFSLYIAPGVQSGGFGSAALRLLVRHGFNAFNLNRIWGEVFDGNPAMTMFQKLGFQKEGTLRSSYFRDGRFIDSHIVSVLRGDKCQLLSL